MPEGQGYSPAQRTPDLNTLAQFAITQRGLPPSAANFSQMKQALINNPQMTAEVTAAFYGGNTDPQGSILDDPTFRPGTRSFDDFWEERLSEVADAADAGAAAGAVRGELAAINGSAPSDMDGQVGNVEGGPVARTATGAPLPVTSERLTEPQEDGDGPPLLPIVGPKQSGQELQRAGSTGVERDIDNIIDAEFRELNEPRLAGPDTAQVAAPPARITGPTQDVEADIMNRIDVEEGTATKPPAPVGGSGGGRAAPQPRNVADRVVAVGETGLGQTGDSRTGSGIGFVDTPSGRVRVISLTLDDGTRMFVDGNNVAYDTRGNPMPDVQVDLNEVAEKFGDARVLQVVRRLTGAIRGAL